MGANRRAEGNGLLSSKPQQLRVTLTGRDEQHGSAADKRICTL
jgi:hypothetical protein